MIAILKGPCSFYNQLIERSPVNILLCVPDSLTFSEIKLKPSFIDLICVNLSSMVMFSPLKKLTDVMDCVRLQNTISVEESFWVPLSYVNNSCSVFSFVDETDVAPWSLEHLLWFLSIGVLRQT